MSDTSVKCLLVHGMTASPRQMEPVRLALERAGYPTNAPLLSGHGTRVDDLIGLHWEDWYADVLRAVTKLSTSHVSRPTRFFYTGISFGALLGLKLAIDRPDLLCGLVCIGTPLTMFGWMNAVYPLINYTPLRWVIPAWPKKFDLAVADPEGREIYKRAGYDRFPLAAVGEVRKLQRIVRRDLHRITTPLLLIHARKDMTAPPEAMEIIRRSVKSPVVEQKWCERSHHVATLDYDRELVAVQVLDFLRQHTG